VKNGCSGAKPPHHGLFKPATAYVQPQPKGVIGIVSPWNYPLYLIIGPLVDAFVAGNRAMVKISEHVPKFAETMASLVPQYFQADELTIVTGGVEVASAFSALPFDHLLFTGSPGVGKHVMRAAANNLTPVTLELGGKSPVIIATDANLPKAVERIMYGKMINAGQTCIAPDYVLLQHINWMNFCAWHRLGLTNTIPIGTAIPTSPASSTARNWSACKLGSTRPTAKGPKYCHWRSSAPIFSLRAWCMQRLHRVN
jgi:coniferyl-aldehyde dehydrogenase